MYRAAQAGKVSCNRCDGAQLNRENQREYAREGHGDDPARLLHCRHRGADLSRSKIARQEFGLRVGLGLQVTGTESITLVNVVDFFRRIRLGQLKASQFTVTLTDATGTFSKPATW